MTTLSPHHVAALNWFQGHVGVSFANADWFEGNDIGQRLATKAKGIYKPADMEYALSIRVSDDGPYRDSSIEFRSDETWSFRYNEETSRKYEAATLFTNRGLMRCIEDSVPVGVVIKTTLGNMSAEYEIGGLGLPVSHENGYFLIEGPFSAPPGQSIGLSFSTVESGDQRNKILRSIVQRQGQGMFRKRLLQVYRRRCALTGFDAEGALEAAHIRPYTGPFSNDVRNGILLRSDIHTLFDLRQVGIDPRTREFVVSAELQKTRYSDWQGRQIFLPEAENLQPGKDFLEFAWGEFTRETF